MTEVTPFTWPVGSLDWGWARKATRRAEIHATHQALADTWHEADSEADQSADTALTLAGRVEEYAGRARRADHPGEARTNAGLAQDAFERVRICYEEALAEWRSTGHPHDERAVIRATQALADAADALAACDAALPPPPQDAMWTLRLPADLKDWAQTHDGAGLVRRLLQAERARQEGER